MSWALPKPREHGYIKTASSVNEREDDGPEEGPAVEAPKKSLDGAHAPLVHALMSACSLRAGKGLLACYVNDASQLTGKAAVLTEHKALQCQLAVAAVQTSFVIGSVYLKSSFRLVQGLHFHPVIFAFAREAIAGPVLCCIAYFTTGQRADDHLLT